MKKRVARDIMNKEVITVPANMSVRELSQLFVDKAITGAPVVDDNNKFIGVVSLTDIARYESEREETIREERPHDFYLRSWEDKFEPDELRFFHIEEPPEATVRQIMTPVMFKVDPDVSVQHIASMMVRGRIHRLIVVEKGEVVGIVSALDLVRLVEEM